MKKLFTLTFLFLTCISFWANAQTNTFDAVYDLLQAKCSGCHGGNNPDGMLNFEGDKQSVYNALVNAQPVNPAAKAAGKKLISPGYPRNSYLLQKINNGLDEKNNITAQEGDAMPPYPNEPLNKEEIELLRQWILYGAAQTGKLFDQNIIHDFYNGNGIVGIPQALEPPPANEGIQWYLGRFFLAPHTETEKFIKFNPQLSQNIEIYKIHVASVPQNHHFVVYKYYPGADSGYPEGLRDTSMSSHGDADIAFATAPGDDIVTLPENTCYRFNTGVMLDFNYHLVNNSNSVLAVDLYANLYTQPYGTSTKPIYSRFFPNFNISIPQDNQEHVFEDLMRDPSETNFWKIWILYTHTHRYGTDYDLYLCNENNEKGEQIYEGFYNYDYTFNQGYYGWGAAAAQRKFSELLTVDPRLGIWQQATYKNTNGPNPIGFGLTSQDEMMVAGFQYTYGDPLPALGTQNPMLKTQSIKASPNPFNNSTQIKLPELPSNQTVTLVIYDINGKEVRKINTNESIISISRKHLQNGIYIAKAFTSTQFLGECKLIVQ